MKKLLLIINPVSGTIKVKSQILNILNLFSANECDTSVVITQRRGHAFNLVKDVSEEYDEIVCCGGDGTLNEVVRGIMVSGLSIPVGYIPAGSTNDFANCMGLSLNILNAAKNTIFGEQVKVDVGKFEDFYFTYIASFGAFTSASYSAPQSYKNTIGHLAYILEGIKDLQKIKPIYVKCSSNGETYSGDYVFGAVVNSTSIGGIVKLDKSLVDVSDGKFEILLVKSPKNINELNKLVISLTSSNFNNSMFNFFKAEEILFEFENDVAWSLDGEYAKVGNNVKIINIKEGLNLIK